MCNPKKLIIFLLKSISNTRGHINKWLHLNSCSYLPIWIAPNLKANLNSQVKWIRVCRMKYLLWLNWVKKTYLFDVIWHDLSVTVDIMCLQFGHDVLQHCYKVLILKVILVKWFMLFSPWVAQIFGSFGRDWTGSLWFSAKADCSKAWWCGFNERFSTKM